MRLLTLEILIGASILLFSANSKANPGDDATYYMSVNELFNSTAPQECRDSLQNEGKIVHVRGFINQDNVFDKKHYPKLPYEKFSIYDKQNGKLIEVWAVADDNSEIFEKVNQALTDRDKEVFVSGTVSSFDMPIMGTCKKGIKIDRNKPLLVKCYLRSNTKQKLLSDCHVIPNTINYD